MNEKPARDGKLAESAAANLSDDAKHRADSRSDTARGGEASTPIEQLMMRREVRLGLAALSLLALVFGYLFVSKISEGGPEKPSVAGANDSGETPSGENAASAPPPTVVTADASHLPPGVSPPSGPERGPYTSDAVRDDLAPPNQSFLPPRHVVEDAAAHDPAESRPEDRGHEPSPNAAVAAANKYSKYLQDDTPQPHANTVNDDAIAQRGDNVNSPEQMPEHAIGHAAEAVASSGDAAPQASRYADETPAVVGDAGHRYDGVGDHRLPHADEVVVQPRDAHPAAIQATPVVEPASPHEVVTADEPPAAAPAQAAAAEPRNRTYVTVAGDTPASIAERLYGEARYAAALMAYNGVEIAPDTAVNAGGEVLVPQLVDLQRTFGQLIPRAAAPAADVATATADASAAPRVATLPVDAARADAPNQDAGSPARAAATREYVVRRGETVYDIARKELGLVSRWRDILVLNQDQLGGDIDAIAPGMRLRLPDEGRSEVARQRGELQWR